MPSAKTLKLNQAEQVMRARRLAINEIISRQTLSIMNRLDKDKDINAACGYPETITPLQYKLLYDREGIAARVVAVEPEESWSVDPEVVESEKGEDSEWEKAWKNLENKFNLYAILQRADRLSGIGHFGIILIGTDDGMPLDQPHDGVPVIESNAPTNTRERKLLYVRAFDESAVKVDTWETDAMNPRFGKPVMYSIQFATLSSDGKVEGRSDTKKVHWTRIIHLADNLENSEVYGTPRMQNVFNRLYDLRKILGGSGEMFWNGGFPGLSLEVAPEALTNPDFSLDSESIKEEMLKYSEGMQRYIALTGIQAKSLAPQVADPGPHLETHIKAICIAKGIPYRIFMGTEQAQLAGTQDIRNWNKRIKKRQEKHVAPMVIRPFILRLMQMGVLKWTDTFLVNWPDLNTLSDEERATIAEKQANALSKYVSTSVDQLVPPLEFFVHFLGLSTEAAQSIVDAAMLWVEDPLNESLIEQDTKMAQATKPVVVPQVPPNGKKVSDKQPSRNNRKKLVKL